jgi:LysR family glycine cleavage system transcriptional activator
VLPSFAQRWLLPRIARWHARHPELALEIDSSQQVVDLLREGFHAAIRVGRGPWPGLTSELLFDSPTPIIAVGSPATARRLEAAAPDVLAREPLLGDADLWQDWFAAAGLTVSVRPVATFNDAGLMLQAAEQSMGLALAREVLAADALQDGRLKRLSPLAITHPEAYPYHLVYAPTLAEWPPLAKLRRWLYDELELSRAMLDAARKSRGSGAAAARGAKAKPAAGGKAAAGKSAGKLAGKAAGTARGAASAPAIAASTAAPGKRRGAKSPPAGRRR